MDRRDPLQRTFAARDPGAIYWISGLPGIGKRTLAQALCGRLSAEGRQVIRLDGDRLQDVFAGRFGAGLGDRRALARIHAQLCRELARQGFDLVATTAALFNDVQQWNREHLDPYFEIYLRGSVEMLAKRHPKGLYAAALAGRVRNVPGVDQPIEEPEAPDILIVDDGALDVRTVAERVLRQLDERPLPRVVRSVDRAEFGASG